MLELLRYLIEHRERVVPKEELLRTLWPGEHVNDGAVAWTVSHIRNALGQERGHKQPIETIHGRGYRFRGALEGMEEVPKAPARVGAIVPPTRPLAPLAPPARPFVGRAEVMRRLESLLTEAGQSRGRLCLLLGEAGIGKSRCIEELRRSALHAGLDVWNGRALEGAFAPVFWPWIQILREVREARPDLRAACDPLLSRLTALERAPSDHERERADRFWLLDEVTRFLVNAVKELPALLLIDDLQWADAGTIDLLSFVATELSASRMLVVATARVTPRAEIDRRIARLASRAERIELSRLSSEHVGEYIAKLTGLSGTPASLVQAVHDVSAGNPLLVDETMRSLLTEHDPAALAELDTVAIRPLGVLQARLAPLGAAERSLLACASVLGEEFELPLLQAITGMRMNELLELIEIADAQGLIVAETPQRCSFSHALIRQLLYKELKAKDRVALHRSAAEALEALRDPEPRHSQIAHHYYVSLPAGGHDRATAAAVRAAVAAEAVFAFEDAVRFYEWALAAQALDDTARPRARAELLLAAGSAQRLAGRLADARKTMARMFELARQHGFADLIVRGVRSLRPTPAMSSLPDPPVRAALEAVLEAVTDPSDEPSIRALAQLACVPPYALDMAACKRMTAQALERARARGGRSLLFEVLCARLYALSGPDDTDALLATAAELLAAEGGRTTPTSIEAHCARAAALIYRGEIAAADEAFDLVGRISSELRLREGVWYRQRQSVQRRFLDGHFDVAEAEGKELRAQGKRLGLYYTQWFTASLRNAIALERGRSDAVAAGYDFSLLAGKSNHVHLNLKVQTTRVAAELGRMADARLGLDLLAAIGFENIPKDIAYLHNLACLALTVVALDDRARAEQLYALLAPYPQHNTPEPTLMYEGSVSRYLALLAACLGRNELAHAHFEDALAMNRRIGQRALLARTEYEYARWLASRPGRGARTRQLSGDAAAIAENLGMSWLAVRARQLHDALAY